MLTMIGAINTFENERVNELTESNSAIKTLNEEYKNKMDTMTGIVEEYKGFKVGNVKLKVSLTDFETESSKLNDNIKEKDFTINSLTKDSLTKDSDKQKNDYEKDINTLKINYDIKFKQLEKENVKEKETISRENNYNIKNLNSTIETLKADNSKEIKSLNKENQLNIKLAVADLKEELNNMLNQEQLKHNSDIQEYQTKYKILLDEFDKKKVTPRIKKESTVVQKK